MKIYTKTGDDGSTGLVGGKRVAKNDARIECYGTVDELNAALGIAAVVTSLPLLDALRAIQAELFVIGSHLATPEEKRATSALPPLRADSIARLEKEMDAADAQLPRLRHFILPGGCELAARLHLARTVCRRAERLVVAFAGQHVVEREIVVYLNRLSDWCFVQARLANHQAGVADVLWMGAEGESTK
jgi:cob(I)alamin adenosyltransferase